MAPFCRIPLPGSSEALLRRVVDAAAGEDLISDKADAIGYLQSQGTGVKGGTPELRRYATFLAGAAISLKDGWSMLPPGLSPGIENLLPPPPSAPDWTAAVGEREAEAWMRLAVWTGCEFTAQRALPLPRMIGVDPDSAPKANENWCALGQTCLTPAVALYRDQTLAMGVDDSVRRAAAALATPSAHYSGPGSDLWNLNRVNRLDLAHVLAQRDPALIADMFALEEGYVEAQGSTLLNPPLHLTKASVLHASALGIFELGEWPLGPDVVSGSNVTVVRQALRRNILAFAAERRHLRSFAVTSGLLVQGDWMNNPHSWQLAQALLATPTEVGGMRSSFATQAAARTLSAHYLQSSLAPSEYVEFRQNALKYNGPHNSIAQLILACDGMVVDGWAQEAGAEEYLLKVTQDPVERKSIAARHKEVLEAQTTLLSVANRRAVLRQCLSNAEVLQDGNLATNVATNIAAFVDGSERDEVAKALAAVLRRSKPLSPESVGKLCRNDLTTPSEVLDARLFYRIHGDGVAGDLNFGLSVEETSRLERVRTDLRSVRGLYFVEHRMLSILETGARAGHCPDSSVLDLIARYNPGGTANGREKELRALFALIAARDHERTDLAENEASYVMRAVELTDSLRDARRNLAISGQLSQEERIMRLLTEATRAPASQFAAGVAIADPTVLNTLHDAHQAKVQLAATSKSKEKAKRVICFAIREYAHGRFQEWKYTHHMAKKQLSHAPARLVELWREDRAWHGEALGLALSVRESSDFGELLRHGDYPVKTCHALLSYGKDASAGLSVLADAHSKLLQFVDPGTHRIVGRSIVRLLYSAERKRSVVLIEAPYTMGTNQANMTMRMIAARAMAQKYVGTGAFVLSGLSAKDREKGLMQDAERHMGRMAVWALIPPDPMVAQHYFDSALQQVANPDGSLEMSCLPEAVEMTREGVSLRPLSSALCRKDPPSLLAERTPEDEEYEARVRQVFPDATERQRFFELNPEIRISGTLPQGHEVRWRECLHKFPRLAEHLHHSSAVQSLLAGAPDPAGDGADARRALSVIEGRPHFRALIQGLSRKEIAAARSQWMGVLAGSMDRDPSRWPPEIDYQQISADVRATLVAAARPARVQAFPESDPRPRPLTQQPAIGLSFDRHAGF